MPSRPTIFALARTKTFAFRLLLSTAVLYSFVGCNKHIVRHGGTMLTPSTAASHIVERKQTRRDPTGANDSRLSEVLHDEARTIDRIPPEGIVFVDTTDSAGQRDMAMVRRSPNGVDLLLHDEQALRVQHTLAQRVVGIPMTHLPLPEQVQPDQAMIAARYPRIVLRHGDDIVLVTNDLRNHNLVDSRGLLQYKIAWEVQHSTIELDRIMDEDPQRYTTWLDVVSDRRAGAFGSPIAWLEPDDKSLPWYRILWKWERLPQWQGHAWFAYVTRVTPRGRPKTN